MSDADTIRDALEVFGLSSSASGTSAGRALAALDRLAAADQQATWLLMCREKLAAAEART